MKTRDGSRILHPDKRMKTSIFHRTRGPKPITRFYTSFRRFGVLVAFFAMLAATFYSASTASVSSKSSRLQSGSASQSAAQSSAGVERKDGGTKVKDAIAELERATTFSSTTRWLSPALMPQAPVGETVTTYASDCTTPKTSFILGQTVCVKVTGAPIASEVQRYVAITSPDGIIMSASAVTSDPQTLSFAISSSATTISAQTTILNRGTWKVNTIAASDASLRSETTFTASDPEDPATDLSVSVNKVGKFDAPAGGTVAFTLEVTNKGPDAAQNVALSNVTPDGTTFVSISQTDGPAFTCVDPGEGNTGTTVCSRASLAKDDIATFTGIYQIGAGVPLKSLISNSASVENNVAELRPLSNTATGTATVGTAGCTVTCPADIVVENADNAAGATVNFNIPSNSCGSTTADPASGSFFPVGTTTVTVSGDSGSICVFKVTVNDTQVPVISCPADVTVDEDPQNPGHATVNYPPPSVQDNEPGLTANCDHPSGSSFPAGDTLVTCTATDSSGNTSEACSFTVHVNSDACALSCPSDVTVNADEGQCGANVSFDVTATDCGTVTYSHQPGSFFPVGTTTVTVTAPGRSCSFNITVTDTTAPTVTLAVPPEVLTATVGNTPEANCVAAIPNLRSYVTASDNCASNLTIIQDPEEGTLVNAGTHTITISVIDGDIDGAHNTTTASVNFTAQDVTPPTIALDGDPSITVECHTSFTDPGATATDDCAGSFPATASDTVDVNTPGTYTVTYTASDPAGNAGTPVTRTVNVVDTQNPTITLNGASTLTVECHTSFNDPGATASDSCASDFPATASGTVDVNTPGSYTVTYNASDPSGNAATPVTRTVNVVDTTPPVITANGANPMTVECHTSFTDPGATATDGCAGSFAASASGAVDVNTPGTYTITYSATDPAGNVATPVTRTVNVVDTTPPTINCPANIAVSLPANSTAVSMPVSYPAVTATDSCGSNVNVTVSHASGSIFPVGTTTVTATATDPAGNTSSCTFTVTVLYRFTGFFSPVDNLPVLNTVNAGRAIPVKFSLSGNKGLSIFAPGHPASGTIACNSTDPVNEVEETLTAGGSSLSYDASSDRYHYVWKTNSAWAGTCRQLVIQLNDGSFYRANFKFR